METIFRCTREVIPYMEENKGGSIVNFGSMYGLVSPEFQIYGDDPGKNPLNYGAGKAAVIPISCDKNFFGLHDPSIYFNIFSFQQSGISLFCL